MKVKTDMTFQLDEEDYDVVHLNLRVSFSRNWLFSIMTALFSVSIQPQVKLLDNDNKS